MAVFVLFSFYIVVTLRSRAEKEGVKYCSSDQVSLPAYADLVWSQMPLVHDLVAQYYNEVALTTLTFFYFSLVIFFL